MEPFKPHMSAEEAQQLKMGDTIDHRVPSGFFCPAIIVEKDESKGTIKLHHIRLSTQYDIERSYVNEFDHFAKHKSISTRPAHRLKDIKEGSFVDVCFSSHPLWKTGQVKGWIKGTVLHKKCPQIKVRFVVAKRMGKASWYPGTMGTWFIHCDNAKEIDRFGIHTNCKQINHFPIAMETKRTYLNIPNEIKQDCAMQIINSVYGGMEHILSYLMKNAATSQLQEMEKIMKQKNIKYLEKIKSQNKNQKNEKSEQHLPKETEAVTIKVNKSVKPKISSLCELSRESIINICDYLNRSDIKSFKLTSFRNGMISLREMAKCNIGMFNTNEIINNPKYIDELSFRSTVKANATHKRYCANTKYLFLRQTWEEKYNIPLSQQLVVKTSDRICQMFNTKMNDKLSDMSLRFVSGKNKFIIFDKRNLVQLDANTNKPKITNSVEHTKKQSLILLKWFDMFEQEIIPLQFIIGNRDTMTIGRLTTYIENEFIVTTQQQKDWQSKLKSKSKKMNSIAPYHQKLIVHKEYDDVIRAATNSLEKLPWFMSIIFQFNPTHPTFAKKKFVSIQEKYTLLK